MLCNDRYHYSTLSVHLHFRYPHCGSTFTCSELPMSAGLLTRDREMEKKVLLSATTVTADDEFLEKEKKRACVLPSFAKETLLPLRTTHILSLGWSVYPAASAWRT
jgi:hypothetical protein